MRRRPWFSKPSPAALSRRILEQEYVSKLHGAGLITSQSECSQRGCIQALVSGHSSRACEVILKEHANEIRPSSKMLLTSRLLLGDQAGSLEDLEAFVTLKPGTSGSAPRFCVGRGGHCCGGGCCCCGCCCCWGFWNSHNKALASHSCL